MGYMRHHTIVVTSFDDGLIKRAHEKAKMFLDRLVSEVSEKMTNGYTSFFIAPDGSKEGWDTSERYNLARECFTDWIDAQKHADDSNSIDYCEVFFGDDEGECEVVSHN